MLTVLSGSVLGYTTNSVKLATFKEGLVALPDPGAKMADGSALLTGADLEAWRGLAPDCASLAKRVSGSDRARRESCSSY